MPQLDPRLLKIGIEVDGKIKTYQNLAMHARGMKYANANQNECEVTIFNLDKSTQDYILTETSPYNQNRVQKLVTVEAGRVSYGTTKIYEGNVVSSYPSQPPDIGVTLRCLTGNFLKGDIISRRQPGTIPLSKIAAEIAKDLDLKLIFQTEDKNIANYSYSGNALGQIDRLAEMGSIQAFADDGVLIIKTLGLPLSNIRTTVNAKTGMIGIPELTERGIKVKFLLDKKTTLGGAMEVGSKIYPAANGSYVIYKLGFAVSNRETPFYWIAEGQRRL